MDYRTLNRKMKPDSWSLPKIEKIFDDLKGSEFYSTLNLFSGYWQVRLHEICKEKTTFVCRFGTYQFWVMSFCLMNPFPTFRRTMDQIFRNLDFVRVYLDEIAHHLQMPWSWLIWFSVGRWRSRRTVWVGLVCPSQEVH